MKHLFIINPLAGKKEQHGPSAPGHRSPGAGYGDRPIPRPGATQRITEEAAARGEAMRIYACGGDGTLNEVVCGAAGQEHLAVTNARRNGKRFSEDLRGRLQGPVLPDLAALAQGRRPRLI